MKLPYNHDHDSPTMILLIHTWIIPDLTGINFSPCKNTYVDIDPLFTLENSTLKVNTYNKEKSILPRSQIYSIKHKVS
jgi:hypothetical protein